MAATARKRRKPVKPLAPDWDITEEAPPTPETVAKLKTDSVRKLVGRGITEPQWEAAQEIRHIREALGRGLFPCRTLGKEMDMVRSSDGFRDPLDRLTRSEERMYYDHYRPWIKEAEQAARFGKGQITFLNVIEVVVIDNYAVRAADKMLGIRNGSAQDILRQSLQRYAEIAGWVQRVD